MIRRYDAKYMPCDAAGLDPTVFPAAKANCI